MKTCVTCQLYNLGVPDCSMCGSFNAYKRYIPNIAEVRKAEALRIGTEIIDRFGENDILRLTASKTENVGGERYDVIFMDNEFSDCADCNGDKQCWKNRGLDLIE